MKSVYPLFAASIGILACSTSTGQEQGQTQSHNAPLRPGVHFESELKTVMFDLRTFRRKGCVEAADAGSLAQTLGDADIAERGLRYILARTQYGMTPGEYQRKVDLNDEVEELNFLRRQVRGLPACHAEAVPPP